MTILISGGSRGLGLAMVRHCLEKGEKVATFARKLPPEICSLRKEYGKRFLFELLNAQHFFAADQFVQRTIDHMGPIGALVNNAAIGQDALLTGMNTAEIGRVLLTNLYAPISLTRSVVRNMLLENTKGRIINISSICASHGYSGLSVYAAAKAGLEAFTRSLSVELGGRGIMVNAISPGFFQSEMSGMLSPDQIRSIERRTPTGRLCMPEDILPVLDLLLFGGSNITGQVFHIDGGVSA